jgi:hypothetical protein
VFLKGEVVAENLVILTSNEWLHLLPSSASDSRQPKAIYGDTIVVEGGVDLDSLIVSFGRQYN